MSNFNQFKNKASQEHYESYLNSLEHNWPIQSKNYYVNTSFGKTFVRETGNGEPLILLPGTMFGSYGYREIIEFVSQHFRVFFVIDIIGDFGRSYLSKRLSSSDDYVKWQEELYDQLHLGEHFFSMMGVSMGAWLAALYACNRSDVKNLILVSPVSVVENFSAYTTITGLLSMMVPVTEYPIMKRYFKDYLNTINDAEYIFEQEIYKPISITKNSLKRLPSQIPKKFTPQEFKSIKSNTLYIVGKKTK